MNTFFKLQPLLNRFLLAILVITSMQTAGFAQQKSETKPASFLWAIRAGSELSGEKVRSLAVGDDGFIYITGQFAGEADFGKQKLTSRGQADCFIAKIDSDGKVIWARQIGGEAIERGYGIDADSKGNVFVTGHFQSGELEFANTKVTNLGDYDHFTASFDQEGNERWIHTGGGPGYDYGHGLDLMPGGGCVVAGRMVGPAQLGKNILETEEKGSRLFVARYGDDGKLIWAKAGGTPATAGAEDVAVDRSGNVWVCGRASNNATYDGQPLGNENNGGLLVAKIAGKDGTLLQATRFGTEAEGHVAGVIPDKKNGGCYICGGYKGTIVAGSNSIESVGDKDIFVAHLNTEGKIDWLKSGGGSGWDLALGIGVDNKGNVLVTGFVTDKGNFGDGFKVPRGADEKQEGFVTCYNPQGKLLWLVTNGGADNEINEDIACDAVGNIIYGGGFRSEGIFGTITLEAKLAEKHGQDIFVAKFRPPTDSVRPGINDKFLDPNLKIDKWVKLFEGESREVFSARSNLLDALNLKPGMHVADVGAGTGLFITVFADQVGPKGCVYAVELSLPFLKRLRDVAKDQKQIIPVLCDEDSVRLPYQSIDVAFTCDVYHHFEYPQKTLKSILSALKPGGRFIVVDFKKIPGVTKEWIMKHVRADKQTVKKEVLQAGFEFVEEKEVRGIQDNYVLVFRKPAQ